jgi:hypothetical protein
LSTAAVLGFQSQVGASAEHVSTHLALLKGVCKHVKNDVIAQLVLTQLLRYILLQQLPC